MQSARWLMEQMGYTAWQKFEPIVERAKTSAAQTYFAVRTREAETRPAFDPATLSRRVFPDDRVRCLSMMTTVENGRWKRGSVREVDAICESANSDSGWLSYLARCGVVLDFKPDLANAVVNGDIAQLRGSRAGCRPHSGVSRRISR